MTRMVVLKFIKRTLDRIFHVLCRFAFRFSSPRPSDTVLLVRTDGIGDLVYSTGYLQAIRERYRTSRLVLCATEESAELAAAMPFLDDVVSFKRVRCRRNYLYRLRIFIKVRSLAPKTAIYVSFHRENIGDEITLFSGARETIAFSGNDECIHPSMRLRNNKEFSRVLQTKDNIPEKEKYAVLMDTIGSHETNTFIVRARNNAVQNITKGIPKDATRAIDSRRYAVVSPGGSGAIRRWPAQMFSELADRISKEFGLSIVLCGNQDEKGILTQIAGGMHQEAQVCSESGIIEVVDILKSAAVFAGNESGLLHLAALLGVPGVGILGGGHFSRYFPYGSIVVVNHPLDCYECNWTCKFPEPYCITEISVDDVLRELRKLRLKVSKR
jgi:ADP-heptose:LPS heptosyltransferase